MDEATLRKPGKATMPLKVYRARSMTDALAEVKKDLGAEAVILHTRSYKSPGILGLGSRSMFEITATNDQPELAKRPERKALRAGSERPAMQSAAAKQLSGSIASRAYAGAGSGGHSGGGGTALAEPPPKAEAHHNAQPDLKVVRESTSEPSRVMAVAGSRQDKVAPSHAGPGIEDELVSIKRMLGRVLATSSQSASSHPGSMPDALFEHYLALTEQSVASEIADEIVGRVRDELSAAELADAEIVRETMLRQIAKLVPAAGDSPLPRRPADGRPLTIALIGPTGVGKTTTLAKLAAVAKLRHGRSVGLVTTDTYRIAAVEQLRTYADIIGLPLKVVASPGEMRGALESLANCDVILIDTAGRSQHDGERLDDLREYLDEADPHETHLVLSTTSAEAVMLRAAERFAKLGPNRLILTKLDEAVNFGVLLSITRSAEIKLSYVTTGQEVPDHIEAGKPDRISRLILGGPQA